jgi:hypothetical protein
MTYKQAITKLRRELNLNPHSHVAIHRNEDGFTEGHHVSKYSVWIAQKSRHYYAPTLAQAVKNALEDK